VRRSCSFVVKEVYGNLTTVERKTVKANLVQALGGDNDIVTRANLASAFDQSVSVDWNITREEGSLTKRLRESVEHRDLANTVTGDRVMIRSSLATIQCWAHLAEWERQTYEHLFPSLSQPIAAKGTPKIITVYVFPDSKRYDLYMNAFVGSGSGAGGFFYEAKDILYTYQRTHQHYYISVEELILHELTHYFNKYHLFPKTFGSSNYDTEPSTWLDEGLAEYMSGLNFDNKGCYSTPLRGNYMRRMCGQQLDSWSLAELISMTESSMFHYIRGYSFVYFLAKDQPQILLGILNSFRNGDYQRHAWSNITGFSLGELEVLWKNSTQIKCNTDYHDLPISYFRSNMTCMATSQTSYPNCAVTGHGVRRMAISVAHDLNFTRSTEETSTG